MMQGRGEREETHYALSSVLRNVHGRLIETYGGLPGVRDEHALESAVFRPRQVAHSSGVGLIARLGAALSWALLRNHAFVDGDKRIALAALTLFAERNGYRLTCSEVEETTMILRAASGESRRSNGPRGPRAWSHPGNLPRFACAGRMRTRTRLDAVLSRIPGHSVTIPWDFSAGRIIAAIPPSIIAGTVSRPCIEGASRSQMWSLAAAIL